MHSCHIADLGINSLQAADLDCPNCGSMSMASTNEGAGGVIDGHRIQAVGMRGAEEGTCVSRETSD